MVTFGKRVSHCGFVPKLQRNQQPTKIRDWDIHLSCSEGLTEGKLKRILLGGRVRKITEKMQSSKQTQYFFLASLLGPTAKPIYHTWNQFSHLILWAVAASVFNLGFPWNLFLVRSLQFYPGHEIRWLFPQDWKGCLPLHHLGIYLTFANTYGLFYFQLLVSGPSSQI